MQVSKKTVQAKKKFGQNFLVSPYHLELLEKKVIDFLSLATPDAILEIGPGMGALTEIILKVSAKDSPKTYLECWEIDPEAIDFLNSSYLGDKINLFERDAIQYLGEVLQKKQEINEVGVIHQNFSLISNLPYNVGSRVLIDLACLDSSPLGFLVLLQKEVGQKLVAREKNINMLGGFLRIFYEFKLLADFPRSAFSPQPNIVSVLVQGILKKDLKTKLNHYSKLQVLNTLKNLLKYPNKTLANNLKNLDWDQEKISTFYTLHKLDKNLRLEWSNYIEILELVLETK